MKYVTYAADGRLRVGILEGHVVLDTGFDGDMVEFIESGAIIRRLTAVPQARIVAPLRPRSLRDFLAFEGHLRNSFSRLGLAIPAEWYSVPAYYKGMPDTVIGPDDDIPWPAYTNQLDHELEVAAIIGRSGRDISSEDASDHIFGYTLWNDLSARDVQRLELPIGMGPAKAKDWDGSNVLGPCIVSPDEVDISNLRLSVRVNGELWGADTTANMHHTFSAMIAYASQAQCLHVGDVLGSGTAAGGSGLEMDRWLSPGDVIELDAEGIGTLRNRVGQRTPRK